MVLFPEEKISATETILGYVFGGAENAENNMKEKLPLATALNASGNTLLLHGGRVTPNKRLAIYGDAIMTKVMCARWLDSGLPLSDWSAVRSTTLATKELARIGKEAGLDKVVVPNDGLTEISGGMLATAVQALIAAVHIDASAKGEADRAVQDVMVKLGIDSDLLKTTS